MNINRKSATKTRISELTVSWIISDSFFSLVNLYPGHKQTVIAAKTYFLKHKKSTSNAGPSTKSQTCMVFSPSKNEKITLKNTQIKKNGLDFFRQVSHEKCSAPHFAGCSHPARRQWAWAPWGSSPRLAAALRRFATIEVGLLDIVTGKVGEMSGKLNIFSGKVSEMNVFIVSFII